MKHQLSATFAVLRKDARLFWQFAALNALLITVWQFPSVTMQLGPVAGILQIALPLANILLILVVFYEDAIVSVKHDWLTRPISGSTLLIAKCVFVVLVIIVPSIFGGVANNLYEGRSVGESLLDGASNGAKGDTLMLILVVMAFAAVTSSIRHAVVIFLAGTVVMTLLLILIARISGLGEEIGMSGSSWILDRTFQILLVALSMLLLWMQYRFRDTTIARTIVVVVLVVGAAAMAAMSWPRMFAVQKALSPDPAAESLVQLELSSGCFPARVFDADGNAPPTAAALVITPDLYWEEQRTLAGPNAIGFSTQLLQRNLPEGYRLTFGRASIAYRADGKQLDILRPGRMTAKRTTTDAGLSAAEHYWLLSRSEYERLATQDNVELHLDYSLSLLAPRATAEFVADGSRDFYPGVGYCGATFDRTIGSVDVDCFKAGSQPAQLVANLAGSSQIDGKASGYPNFTPAALDFWGGERHLIKLRTKNFDAPRVIVTAYEARVHFDRRFVVPGVLGESVSLCPAP